MDVSVFKERYDNLVANQRFAEDFVKPDYGGLNIKNILPQIAALFGIGSLNCSTMPEDCLAEMDGINKVILLVLDGLGYNRLLHYLGIHNNTFAKLAEKGVFKPITTVFPSTTSTALTSLFSGLSPAQHQIIGYHMFSKKYGLIYNTLDMKPVYGYSGRVELAQDYSRQIQLLAPLIEEKGVKMNIITKGSIIGSGLSQITHRDLKPVPYLLSSDMWVNLKKAAEKPGPSISIAYYSGVDSLAHKYGAYSDEVTFEISTIEHTLNDFFDHLSTQTKQETVLVITADHGLATVNQPCYLKDESALMQQLVLPPVGDGRATYLFCKSSGMTEFRDAFTAKMPGFNLFSTDELIRQGLFGPPINLEELKERLGDFTVLSTSDRLLEYPFYDDDRQSPQASAHGGMTAEEMIVPLISVKLSAL